jgi:hypothetical protein
MRGPLGAIAHQCGTAAVGDHRTLQCFSIRTCHSGCHLVALTRNAQDVQYRVAVIDIVRVQADPAVARRVIAG